MRDVTGERWVWAWVWKSDYTSFRIPCEHRLNDAGKRKGTAMIWISYAQIDQNGDSFDLGVVAVENEGVYISMEKEKETIDSDSRSDTIEDSGDYANSPAVYTPGHAPILGLGGLDHSQTNSPMSSVSGYDPIQAQPRGWRSQQLDQHSVESGSAAESDSYRGTGTPTSVPDASFPPESPTYSYPTHLPIFQPVGFRKRQDEGLPNEYNWQNTTTSSNPITLPHFNEIVNPETLNVTAHSKQAYNVYSQPRPSTTQGHHFSTLVDPNSNRHSSYNNPGMSFHRNLDIAGN